MAQQGVIYFRKKKTLKLYVKENYPFYLMALKYILQQWLSSLQLKNQRELF